MTLWDKLKVCLMCFSSFAAALSAVSVAVHEENFEMLCFSSGPASSSTPEKFSGFFSVGIFVFCLMRTGYSIESHIHTGQKCLQAGIPRMPDNKAEERWFWHRYETNEKKLLNSQFIYNWIYNLQFIYNWIWFQQLGKENPYFNICHKTTKIPEAGACNF